MSRLTFFWMLLLGALLLPAGTRAQSLPDGIDETFPVSGIKLALIEEGTDAVVRAEVHRFEVENDEEATERVRRVVTVFSADGREAGLLFLPYDKFRSIKKLKGRLRDAAGREIRELGKSDISDYSAISNFSLYEDNRVRIAELYHSVYPYTVEFEYEIEYDGLISWPDWYPQWRGQPVEHARFEIVAPPDLPVRYMAQGIDLEPRVIREKKRQVYRWEVAMLPSHEPEPYGPSWREQAAVVYTAPATFEIEGTRGDMRSWEAFGKWYYSLSEGRAVLPPEVVQEVQALVAGAQTRREKAERLYRYLQTRTRYVSIQLGLGGWQPFEAAYVHKRGYGDCKALVTYMQALLRAAGLEAYPVLIRHGRDAPDVLADFPSNQFNHVVLAVPMEDGELLWLECTSQTIPFGHLGAGNEDRNALLITAEGGKIVRTPRSTAADNRQVRHARVELSETGDATAEVQTLYTGNQQDRVRQALAKQSTRDRIDWLRRTIDAASFDILEADFSEADAGEATLSLPVKLRLRRYASPTGTRLFFPLNPVERFASVPPAMSDPRTQPVDFGYAFADADTVTYALPEGYAVEALPRPVSIETPFARYEAAAAPQPDGTLRYQRRFEVTEPTLQPAQYGAFRAFLQEVAQADHAQVVLVRQD